MPTLGVSVAVPDPWGGQLQRYRVQLGEQAARQVPTHITLLPPHEVADEELPGVVDHLAEVAASGRPFRVHLRGTGTFRPVSPVVFVNVVEGISACEQLTDGVRRGPLVVDAAYPYHPHVTVAHHLGDASLDRAFAELADFEAVFEVGEVWMYLHDAETGWVPTRSFALGRG